MTRNRFLLQAILSSITLPILLAALPAQRKGRAAEREAPGRYVRIELSGEKRVLSLAEVEVIRNGRNLATFGKTTQIDVASGGVPSRAIDGSHDGAYPNGSITHTSETKDPWWELDLGVAQGIDQITVWNRTDCCGERLEGFRIAVLSEDREVVWERSGQPAPGPRRDFSLWGATIVRPEVSPEARQKLQGGIDRAIERGTRYLIETQLRDGSWAAHAERFGSGQTALSLYTLLRCGVPRTHPSVELAIGYLREQEPTTTYATASTLMAAGAFADPGHRHWMQLMLDQLVEWQDGQGGEGKQTGMWSYPTGAADLSNTQYAVLGLHAARKAGHDVPRKVWLETLETTLQYQEEPYEVESSEGAEAAIAGFVYNPVGAGPYGRPTGSMTAAGISILSICEWALDGKLPAAVEKRVALSKEHALAWLAHHFSVSNNPGHIGNHGYYLYGLERVGALLGIDKIGIHDWYWEGAEHLVESQAGGGEWENQTRTCFSLLFLSRATAASTGPRVNLKEGLHVAEDPNADVRWRATGESPLTMWITGFGKNALNDFADEEGPTTGLRVRRVEYLADGEVIASVTGDPATGWSKERFAVRQEFDRRGTYELRARVFVVDPYTEDGEGTAELSSEPMRIEVRNITEDWRRDYATHGKRNILIRRKVKALASSQKDDGHGPGKAVDGLHGTAWLADPADATPTITVELEKGARARYLLLSHSNPNPREHGARDRASVVHVLVNRSKEPLVVELSPSDERKTVVELPKTARIRKLQISIVERVPGASQKGLVGFGEIELLVQ